MSFAPVDMREPQARSWSTTAGRAASLACGFAASHCAHLLWLLQLRNRPCSLTLASAPSSVRSHGTVRQSFRLAPDSRLAIARPSSFACGSQNRARSAQDRPPRAACESRRLEAKAGPKGMRLRAEVASPSDVAPGSRLASLAPRQSRPAPRIWGCCN